MNSWFLFSGGKALLILIIFPLIMAILIMWEIGSLLKDASTMLSQHSTTKITCSLNKVAAHIISIEMSDPSRLWPVLRANRTQRE